RAPSAIAATTRNRSSSPRRPVRVAAVTAHTILASIRQERDGKPRISTEQHPAGDSRQAEPVSDLVDRGVERRRVVSIERKRELYRAIVLEVPDRHADQGETSLLDHWHRSRQQSSRRVRDHLRLGRPPRHRERTRGAREIIEAETQDYGPADAVSCAHPPRDAIDEAQQSRVDLVE